MQPLTKAVTVFALAGAATAFVPESSNERVEKLAPGSVHGDIELVSFGIATLSADRGPAIAAVHVREAFANRDDKLAWAVDVSLATVWFGGPGAPVHAALANSNVASLPLVRVAPGERRTVDLYFPLPANRMFDEELTPFTVTYRLHTPDRRYEGTATLARSTHWPSRDERAPEPGWGRSWWAAPTYPWTEYWRRPGYAVPRPPVQIEILHMPSGYFEALPPLPADVAGDDAWPVTAECDEW